MSVRRAIVELDPATVNVAEFCRTHDISRDRFYSIRRRHAAEGDAGLEPRSRAPHRIANRIPAEVEDEIVAIRKELSERGYDAGPATIWTKLPVRLPPGVPVPSEATIWRILTRRGQVVADPTKAPKRTVRRFAAERANECWQIDDTGWPLADGTEVKIINVIDDCTRLLTSSNAVATCTGAHALEALAHAANEWGWPERVLSDNAKAFRDVLAPALGELGIQARHSRPYHPQTCGKVERFHQTLKKFLAAQDPPTTIVELQAQLDRFRSYYNHQRPHRAINRATPASVWQATAKSGPAAQPITAPTTVSTNTVSRNGYIEPARSIAISLGTAHTGQRATTIITGTQAHVFIDGRLQRRLTIDPTRRVQARYDRAGRPTTKT